MTGGTIQSKAHRLLCAGRVRVVKVEERRRLVLVKGDTGVHRVLWAANRWVCSCPSQRRCSHILAAELVVGWEGIFNGGEVEPGEP
jgi:hypothetical protein